MHERIMSGRLFTDIWKKDTRMGVLSVCQKTIVARERPSLLLEEKVSPVRTLVTDVVEKVTNSPEVW